MKTNLLKAFALALLVPTFTNCSVEPTEQLLQEETALIENVIEQVSAAITCNAAPPQVQIINNGTVAFNLEVYSADLILQNSVYDLPAGSNSAWLTFNPGITLFSLSNTGFSDEKIVFDMSTCSELMLEIAPDNTLLPTQPTQF